MGFTFKALHMIGLRCTTILSMLMFARIGGITPVAAIDLPPGFAETEVADGLNPTAMALAPDGQVFLAQKDGRIYLMHSDGTFHSEPFVTLAVDDFNERGLCGIAISPFFETEPWVYVYYTVKGGDHNRISRIWANGDFALPGSEQVLLELPTLNGNIHNGGALAFGPDAYLYIGVGDGANSANAQNLNTVLGKILRLDINGAIPVSNPYYQTAGGINRAIYAYGVRNPFSMSADPQSGRIMFCDVGNGAWEEVNELYPGKNYGWSLVEGPLNGQTPPPDFQPPLYAYPHTEGCAVVGAAFGFSALPFIPKAFQRQFLFADYCQGWIRMLDPETGQYTGTFASGIDRPVSLLALPNGELFYFARAGLGGGSPGDNTASSEGTLWKIFWSGDGAPLVTGQAQGQLLPEGETAVFSIQAFGHQPINYQWFRNQTPIADADQAEFILENISLQDSGAIFYCVVSNSVGADTSAGAMLRVTRNKRPVPEIIYPSANARYGGGDTLHFAGTANDPEEGALLQQRLSWRIDFHHASHTHPALSPVQGISEGLFYVPLEGETATDVFYRIYLTATDSAGLSQTVWRDVQPEFSTLRLGGPPGLPVNIDGQIRTLPVEMESVVRLQRHVEVPAIRQVQDTTYRFKGWSDGFSAPLRVFAVPEFGISLGLEYDRFTLGNGSGLRGAYFFDPNGDLSETPAFVRIDSIIQFNWATGSPDPDLLPADYFTVRWTGFVQPVFSGPYTFSVRSDDGCRLWVGDSLLIDKWQPQTATEHSGTIWVKGGQLYPIRLEYLEIGGGSLVELRWSNPLQPKEIIPARQLYAADDLQSATLHGTIGIDSNADGLYQPSEPALPGVQVSLFDFINDSLIARQNTLGDGRYYFTHLLPGPYYLLLDPLNTADPLTPSEHLDAAGRTPAVDLLAGESRTWNAAWILAQPALYGTVWFDANNNDLQDNGEAGIPGVVVLLYRADSTFVDATATQANGGYLFSLLEPGDYFLLFDYHFPVESLEPGFGMNDAGQTLPFSIYSGKGQEINVAFVPRAVSGVQGTPQPPLSMSLFPNPAKENLTVFLAMQESQMVSLDIFDLAGRRLYRREVTAPPGSSTRIIPVTAYPPGVYLLTCNSDFVHWQKVWVKQ